MKLYDRLQRKSQDDIKYKLKLDALCATLDRFNLEGEEREILAEAILRLEKKWGKKQLIPGDVEMIKLMETFKFFQAIK